MPFKSWRSRSKIKKQRSFTWVEHASFEDLQKALKGVLETLMMTINLTSQKLI